MSRNFPGKNNYLKGGLSFTGRKSRPLEPRKSIYADLSSEDQMQMNFFNWLGKYEMKFPVLQLVFAIPNGGFRSETTAKIMKATGARAGVWDIIALAPSACGKYSALVIEHKTVKTSLSDAQRTFGRMLVEHNPTVQLHVSKAWFKSANIVMDYFALPLTRLDDKTPAVDFMKFLENK